MTKKSIDKEQIWTIVFIVLPVILLMNLGAHYTDHSGMHILYSGVFGGLGGLIGFGTSYAVKGKSTLIKCIALALLLVTSWVAAPIANSIISMPDQTKIAEDTYLTCPVCGYKSLDEAGDFCLECFAELSEEEMEEEEYSSMEAFLIDEQMIYFAPDTLVESIDFYNPKVSEDGYKKDLNWKPSVSVDSVLKFNRQYVAFLKEEEADNDSLKFTGEYLACPVCGYKSLDEAGDFCTECLVEFTEEEMKAEEFRSMEEFIQFEQTFFFNPDTLADTIDFYTPKVSNEGYKKDLDWKPSVSVGAVLEYNKRSL